MVDDGIGATAATKKCTKDAEAETAALKKETASTSKQLATGDLKNP